MKYLQKEECPDLAIIENVWDLKRAVHARRSKKISELEEVCQEWRKTQKQEQEDF